MTPPEVLAYSAENGSQPNGPGWRVRAVSNKFPAFVSRARRDGAAKGCTILMNGIGAHEVLIESPPTTTAVIADLELHRIEELLWAYREQLVDLTHRDGTLSATC